MLNIPRYALRHQGFTLIEAMIGLALSSAIMLGVSQMFVANSETYKLVIGQSTMQESGRFALSAISRSAQSAGYKGCFSREEDEALYKTFQGAVPYEFDLDSPIRTLTYVGGGWLSSATVSPLPTTIGGTDTNVFRPTLFGGSGIPTDKVLAGTDILTLTYVPQSNHRLTAGALVNGVNADITVTDTNFEFDAGHIALIHDCERQSLFTVTGTTGSTIERAVDPAAGFYENTLSMSSTGANFEDDAYVSAIVSDTYFIAPSSDQNNVGNPIMSLWRKTSINAPVEVVAGVEDLKIRYGVDTTGDGIPNRYVDANAGAAATLANVMTLRITIVATSIDDVGATLAPTQGCLTATPAAGTQFCTAGSTDGGAPGFDGVLRRSFSQTIALRNRL
jgi:type IV pilus assembly protein PilW